MDVTTVVTNTTITEDINRDLTNNDDVMVVAERMHYISSSFAGTIFLIFGLAGNILSLIIWCKKSKISSTEMYLIAQSITDIGVLVLFFLTDSLIMIQPSIKESYAYGVFYSYIGYPLFYFFVVNSIWNLVGVTVDRYINVCWYQQAKVSIYLLTLKAPLTTIAGAILRLRGLIYHMHVFFSLKARKKYYHMRV